MQVKDKKCLFKITDVWFDRQTDCLKVFIYFCTSFWIKLDEKWTLLGHMFNHSYPLSWLHYDSYQTNNEKCHGKFKRKPETLHIK